MHRLLLAAVVVAVVVVEQSVVVAEEEDFRLGAAPAGEGSNIGNSLEGHQEVGRTEGRIVAENHQAHVRSSGQEGLIGKQTLACGQAKKWISIRFYIR